MFSQDLSQGENGKLIIDAVARLLLFPGNDSLPHLKCRWHQPFIQSLILFVPPVLLSVRLLFLPASLPPGI